MAGRTGTITFEDHEGSGSSANGRIKWSTSLISGNTYTLNVYMEVQGSVTGVSSGSRTCWWHFYFDGDTTEGNIKITDSSWYPISEVNGDYTITADDDGYWDGNLGGLFGFSTSSTSTGSCECSANKSDFRIGDPNYSVTYYTNDGSGNEFNYSEGYYNNNHTVISDKPTHYGATSRSETFTITGKANGGNSDLSVTATKNIKITYTLLGWNTNSNATTALYTAGDRITVSKNITLYGIWSKSESVTGYLNNTLADLGTPVWNPSGSLYDITLVPNNGENSSTIQAGLYTTHTFKGWSSTANGSVLDNTKSYTSDATVYALWEDIVTDKRIITLPTPEKATIVADTYTITLNPNGGKVTPTSMTAEKGIHYNFKGWSTVNNSSSNIVSNPYTPGGSAISLYAIWETVETTDTLSLPIPTMTDFKFLGWVINTNSADYVDMNYFPTQDITLYAMYKPVYTAEIYVWHNERWCRTLLQFHYDGVFNECISST